MRPRTLAPTPSRVLLVLAGRAHAGATFEFGLGGGLTVRSHDDGSSNTARAVAAP